MYSMRYGTVPVVRATGGLADTVQEFDPATAKGTGFRFDEYDPAAFQGAIDAGACITGHDKRHVARIMVNGMTADFSWARSAQRYVEVYESVRKRYPA